MKTTLDILTALCVVVLLFLALAALGCESDATKPDTDLTAFEQELVGAVSSSIGVYLDTVCLVPPYDEWRLGRENLCVKRYDFGGE